MCKHDQLLLNVSSGVKGNGYYYCPACNAQFYGEHIPVGHDALAIASQLKEPEDSHFRFAKGG